MSEQETEEGFKFVVTSISAKCSIKAGNSFRVEFSNFDTEDSSVQIIANAAGNRQLKMNFRKPNSYVLLVASGTATINVAQAGATEEDVEEVARRFARLVKLKYKYSVFQDFEITGYRGRAQLQIPFEWRVLREFWRFGRFRFEKKDGYIHVSSDVNGQNYRLGLSLRIYRPDARVEIMYARERGDILQALESANTSLRLQMSPS